MDSESIIDEIGTEQGWNDDSKLSLCLQYIDNQKDNEAFRAFLQEQADEENSFESDGR